MSYKSKRIITSMFVSIFLFIGYYAFVLAKHPPLPQNMQPWAIATLIFIVVSVAAQIAVQILFHIALSIGIAVKDKETDDKKIEKFISVSAYEDEMDKLIALKAMRIFAICVSLALVAAIAALALGASSLIAFYILFALFAAGILLESGTKVYWYERGLQNG